MFVGGSGDQNRVLDSWELELHVIVSHWMWVLGTELQCSERPVITLTLLVHLSCHFPLTF